MRFRQPPRLATWLLKRLGSSPNNREVLGDLSERYQQGEMPAWYWKQTMVAIAASAFEDIRHHKGRAFCALAGCFVVLALCEVFVSRSLPMLPVMPLEWGNSARTLYEFAIHVAIGWFEGITSGWTLSRLYRGRAIILVFLVISVFLATVGFVQFYYIVQPSDPVSTAFFMTGLISLILGVLVGGLWSNIPKQIAAGPEGDRR